jgi:hypothetical protein
MTFHTIGVALVKEKMTKRIILYQQRKTGGTYVRNECTEVP